MTTNTRKILVGSCVVLALLLLLLGKKALGPSLNSKELQQALRQGLKQAQQGMEGGGIIDGAADRMARPGGAGATGQPGENRQAGTEAPGGLVGEDTWGEGAGQGRSNGTAGSAGAGEKLKRVRIKDREKGERRMYGNKGGGGNQPTTFAPVRYRAPDEAAIAAKMAAFLQRVQQAGPQNVGGDTEQGGDGDGNASGGGSLPILTLEGIDEENKTPTMKTLEKLNKQSAHSVNMSADPGLTDGSRDKSGKGFDGNAQTFGAIPVEEITGAFGGSQLRAVTEPEVDSGSRVPNLK
jgi:hypothetical protein